MANKTDSDSERGALSITPGSHWTPITRGAAAKRLTRVNTRVFTASGAPPDASQLRIPAR